MSSNKILAFQLIQLLFIFNINQNCNANLLCKLSIPAVDLSLPNLLQLESFFESQEIDAKVIDDIKITEAEIYEQVALYKAGLVNEDINLSLADLIKKYTNGCVIETHEVTTTDGYILTMQRIPGNGSVVFLMHGLLNSADDWVTGGKVESLPIMLADAGYDVWFGNARGNKYSRKHESLSPDCADFWDFSWNEIGKYDLPAMIDYILNETGQDRLSYVGFSQGCTSFFVMGSELPEYNDKISVMAALAPVAYMSHAKSPLIRILSLANGIIDLILSALGVNEILPGNAIIHFLATFLCGDNALADIVCSNLLFILSGFDCGQMNATNIPVIFGHTPAGASSKQLVHYAQLVESANFCQFDYVESTNIEVYGTNNPPNYTLGNISAPIALISGTNDWFVNETDLALLRSQLPNVVASYLIEDYSHLDFIWALNVKELVYNSVLNLIKEYA